MDMSCSEKYWHGKLKYWEKSIVYFVW